MISIEREIVENIDLSEAIKEFAPKNCGKSRSKSHYSICNSICNTFSCLINYMFSYIDFLRGGKTGGKNLNPCHFRTSGQLDAPHVWSRSSSI
jgi:hypothetical protein